FRISNCAPENQVKFETCTFTRNALTWWNSHIKVVTQDVAYAMDWKALMKMTDLEFANDQMDQKVLTNSERQAEQKGKLEFNAGNNQGYQQLPKRKSVAQAYAVGTGESKEYAGTLPLCNKCKFHHHGPCTVK
ncbi:hypothetical protein Tco_0207501, partial [Tanacetum coccineum]